MGFGFYIYGSGGYLTAVHSGNIIVFRILVLRQIPDFVLHKHNNKSLMVYRATHRIVIINAIATQ